jgi:hypothetical protein
MVHKKYEIVESGNIRIECIYIVKKKVNVYLLFIYFYYKKLNSLVILKRK